MPVAYVRYLVCIKSPLQVLNLNRRVLTMSEKKTTKYRWLVWLIMIIFCSSCWPDNCELPPCVPPNINRLIRLELSFLESEVGDSVSIVRIEKFNKTVLDTIGFKLPDNRQITIGGDQLNFSLPGTRPDIFTVPYLDYKIIIIDQKVRDITDIEIVDINEDECSCYRLQISTLKLDDKVIDVNSEYYKLEL